MGQETGDITVTDNVNAEVRSDIYGPGSGTSREYYGSITTTINSRSGTFSLYSSDGSSAPSDDATGLPKLVEYADDMIAHWTAVKAKIQSVAPSA